MKIIDVDIESLIPDPENARTHDEKNLAAIRGSIKQFDVVEPLVVWKKNNVVLGGNGRLEVMKKMGFKTAPVHYVDLDDKKAKALALALNRTAELADWNMDRLKEQLAEIDDPELIGFDEDFVKFDDDPSSTPEQDEKEDDVPDVDDNPYGVKRGDIWLLGAYLECDKCGVKVDYEKSRIDTPCDCEVA